MYTVLILAHTIDNSFNKENRIEHDLHLEVCHISNELDGVATCHHWWPCLPHWWVAVLLCCWSQMYAACVDNNFNSSTYMWWHWWSWDQTADAATYFLPYLNVTRSMTGYQYTLVPGNSSSICTKNCAYSLKLNFYLVFFCHTISSKYILALAFYYLNSVH